MNIISIFGGPRKKGNTATILGWVEEELKTLGHQIERINLALKKSEWLCRLSKMQGQSK